MQNNNDEISVEHLPEMFPQFYQTAEDDTILNSIELKIAQHLASLHQIKLTTEKQSDKYIMIFKFTISKINKKLISIFKLTMKYYHFL